MRLYHLALVPVLTASMLTVVACKEEGPSTSKSTIYTYELTGTYANGAKKKIGGRYEYGSRAAKLSSNSGKIVTKLTTAGPKRVVFDVLSTPSAGSGTVKCSIVVKKNGSKFATVSNSGKNNANCTFKP